MKLNWLERQVVNSPFRMLAQSAESVWFASRAAIRPGGNILEIGCGRGAGARLILRRFRPRRLTLVDLDPQMIRGAGAYLTPSEKMRTSFLVADAERLPLPSAGMDAVFGFGFLHHVPDWRRALSEIARVLAVRGTYCMEEIFPPLYQNRIAGRLAKHPTTDRFDSADLKEVLKRCGFVPVDTMVWKSMGILGVFDKK